MVSELFKAILLLTAFLLMLTGCQQRQAAEPAPAPAFPPQVEMQPGLAQTLSITRITEDRPEHGEPYRVNVDVRALTQVDLFIEYRLQFYDEMGRPTRRDVPWEVLQVPARSHETISATAIDSDAVEWRLQLRHAR